MFEWRKKKNWNQIQCTWTHCTFHQRCHSFRDALYESLYLPPLVSYFPWYLIRRSTTQRYHTFCDRGTHDTLHLPPVVSYLLWYLILIPLCFHLWYIVPPTTCTRHGGCVCTRYVHAISHVGHDVTKPQCQHRAWGVELCHNDHHWVDRRLDPSQLIVCSQYSSTNAQTSLISQPIRPAAVNAAVRLLQEYYYTK